MSELEVRQTYYYTETGDLGNLYQLEVRELRDAPKGFMRRALEAMLAEMGDEEE